MVEKTPGGYTPEFPIKRSLNLASRHDALVGRLKSAHSAVLDARREFLAQRREIAQQLRSGKMNRHEERRRLAALADKLGTRLRQDLVPAVRDGRRRIAELEVRPTKEASVELDELAGQKIWNGQRDGLTSAAEVVEHAFELTENWMRRESGSGSNSSAF